MKRDVAASEGRPPWRRLSVRLEGARVVVERGDGYRREWDDVIVIARDEAGKRKVVTAGDAAEADLVEREVAQAAAQAGPGRGRPPTIERRTALAGTGFDPEVVASDGRPGALGEVPASSALPIQAQRRRLGIHRDSRGGPSSTTPGWAGGFASSDRHPRTAPKLRVVGNHPGRERELRRRGVELAFAPPDL